jgi:methylmalonyl-CoA mutase, C-terminal domain
VVAGGTIPKADIPRIKELGVAEVFGPGTRLAAIVDFIRQNAHRQSPLW